MLAILQVDNFVDEMTMNAEPSGDVFNDFGFEIPSYSVDKSSFTGARKTICF